MNKKKAPKEQGAMKRYTINVYQTRYASMTFEVDAIDCDIAEDRVIDLAHNEIFTTDDVEYEAEVMSEEVIENPEDLYRIKE